jgi:hypothetical protein
MTRKACACAGGRAAVPDTIRLLLPPLPHATWGPPPALAPSLSTHTPKAKPAGPPACLRRRSGARRRPATGTCAQTPARCQTSSPRPRPRPAAAAWTTTRRTGWRRLTRRAAALQGPCGRGGQNTGRAGGGAGLGDHSNPHSPRRAAGQRSRCAERGARCTKRPGTREARGAPLHAGLGGGAPPLVPGAQKVPAPARLEHLRRGAAREGCRLRGRAVGPGQARRRAQCMIASGGRPVPNSRLAGGARDAARLGPAARASPPARRRAARRRTRREARGNRPSGG